MRVGLTSDLHYGLSKEVTQSIIQWIDLKLAAANLDVLVVAGDLAETQGLSGANIGHHHRVLLKRLGEAVKCPIAFCAGNHDIWTTDPELDSTYIYEKRLADIAAESGTTYLDQDLLELDGLIIAGCYGHFDYSLQIPNLRIGEREVTEDHYRRQTPPGHKDPVWMDGRRIRWPFSDQEACTQMCLRAADRMHQALTRESPILFVSHTVPRQEINGHFTSSHEISLFLNAFSGTHRLEDVIRLGANHTHPLIAVSGHTHRAVSLQTIDGIHYLNVGGEYGSPRLDILHISTSDKVSIE